jgi:chromate reductase, NAD(P)H dehydrogenase (quinone)
VQLLLISGSLRQGSYNRALLRAAAELLAAEVVAVELEGIAKLPAYEERLDTDEPPASVASLRERFRCADALLFATPEYNASIPGALKNALDWASRPWPDCALRGKPAAVVGASTGIFGGVWAQGELRKVLATIGADVLDIGVTVGSAHDVFDINGGLTDATLRASLRAVVTDLVAHAAERVRVSR